MPLTLNWRRWMSFFSLFTLTVLSITLVPSAKAGILLEAQWHGIPISLATRGKGERVLVRHPEFTWIYDRNAKQLHISKDGRLEVLSVAAKNKVHASPVDLQLNDWSQGPPVAGHASRYNVLNKGEAICAEVLTSTWMDEFLAPLSETLLVMQDKLSSFAPQELQGCGAVPMQVFSSKGFPLVVGYKDRTIFETKSVAFDHKITNSDLGLPPSD